MAAGSTDEMVRAARNQSLYREVNERIEDLNKRFDAALSAGATWVCECADTECSEPMELTTGEYGELRSHPNRFAVLPGHVLEKVEHVVDTQDGYVVVEKVGPAAAFVAELDPRKGDHREDADAAWQEALGRYERKGIIPLAHRTRERIASLLETPT